MNAQKFGSTFYANPDLRVVRSPEEPMEHAPAKFDLEALVEQFRHSPEQTNHIDRAAGVGPIRKIDRKNRISKFLGVWRDQ